MAVKVVEAVEGDVDSWMELVREVEPLFGPMPDFETPLRRGISRGTALCVHGVQGQVVGGMLLGAPGRTTINWLAVRSDARREGVGKALVAEALRQLPADAQLTVDTFGLDNLEGLPARRLYESFGFVAAQALEPGPEGRSRQRFRLTRP